MPFMEVKMSQSLTELIAGYFEEHTHENIGALQKTLAITRLLPEGTTFSVCWGHSKEFRMLNACDYCEVSIVIGDSITLTCLGIGNGDRDFTLEDLTIEDFTVEGRVRDLLLYCDRMNVKGVEEDVCQTTDKGEVLCKG